MRNPPTYCRTCAHWAIDTAPRTPTGRLKKYAQAKCLWEPPALPEAWTGYIRTERMDSFSGSRCHCWSPREAAETPPCPFCGSTHLREIAIGADIGDYNAIECANCYAVAPRGVWINRTAKETDA